MVQMRIDSPLKTAAAPPSFEPSTSFVQSTVQATLDSPVQGPRSLEGCSPCLHLCLSLLFFAFIVAVVVLGLSWRTVPNVKMY